MDLSIVIPTYNEADNIPPLLAQVFQVLKDSGIDGEVIIVDDDSPDRTWELAQDLMVKYDGLQVIRRRNEKGLSTAVLAGFKAASADRVMVMDADLSHPPAKITDLYNALDTADISVASRYVKGGGVKDWPLSRRLVSKGATTIAKVLTSVKDPMSGFFALRKEVIEDVELSPKGYKILLEVLVRGRYGKVKEIPFVFEDRRAGESKLSSGVCMKFISHTLSLLRVSQTTKAQLVRFSIVGGLGTLVNLAVLWSLVELGSVWYISAAVLSFVAAVTFNFVGNKVFAFRDRRMGTGTLTSQYVKFTLVSIASLFINLAVLFLLVDMGGLWYIPSQVVAIVAATAGNFVGAKFWTFGSSKKGPAVVAKRHHDLKAPAANGVILGQAYGCEGRKGQ